VSHLAHTEEFAAQILADGEERLEAEGITDIDEWTETGVELGRGRRHQEIIEWWRFGRADVVDALSRMLPSESVPWISGTLSTETFAAVRLMETWAHGLDVKCAILDRITPLDQLPDDDEDYVDPLADTTRLRHIASLGHKTLPFVFERAGLEYPKQGIRVEVMGPFYSAWRYGPEDSDQVIKGRAADWCRVVVQRQNPEDTALTAVGDHAETALQIASAY
jgi:hypothetical protein